ncbi:MAG TPA: hypothetical protein DFR83_10200 [Deltaproteobacteria bacterium]|nr:hypothetical protein [Deltaproteobacteria bacterium]
MAAVMRMGMVLVALLVTGCGKGCGGKKSRKKRRNLRTERAEKEAIEAQNAMADRAEIERRGETPEDAPNILLVSLDTLRADGLDAYGGLPDNAPFLNKMAEEGVWFEYSYAQAPSTSPTHASMFTSVLPSEHGIMGTDGRLPASFDTLAEYMQSYGIRTWAAASSVRFAVGVQLNQGFDEYAVFAQGSQMRKSDQAMEVALAAIAAQPDRPWFGFLHLMDVHAPYNVKEPHQSRYLKGAPSVDPKETVRFLHKHRLDKDGVTAQQLTDLKAMYAGGVSHVDTRIAALLDAVRAIERPTLVVVTADHGEAFFEKNFLGHGTYVHEAIVRVPLVFWGPGLVPGGQKRSTLAQSIDLFPTLMHFAQLPVPDGLRGADLYSVIQGRGEQTGRSVVAQSRKWQMLVRDTEDGVQKLVLTGKGRRPRLYDLASDPLEQTNLADAESAKVDQWSEQLMNVSFRAKRKANGARTEQWEMSSEEREALEAIGYMDVAQ